ncbi:MAG TPA: hemerythrin domain-containing protein [Chitinophagaceae bacterium]
MAVKRSQELQPLSRQHHNGLLFCLLLQKGLKKQADLEVMQEFIRFFWYHDLQHHFELEEKFLVPLKSGYHQLTEGIDRMLQEHYQLRNIINEISIVGSYASIAELRDQLDAHIRFEERELFPRIEEVISEQQRKAIGAVLSHERDGNCMNYPIKFWE